MVPNIVDIMKSSRPDGRPAYERLADAVADAIRSGEVAAGARLPTVRSLSSDLGVSATTVMAVYNRLADAGLTSGAPGRGTFVRELVQPDPAPVPVQQSEQHQPRAWRRQMLAEAESRLRARYPDALELTRGSPARDVLPADVLARAWQDTARRLAPQDLEYPHMLAADPLLRDSLEDRLGADGLELGHATLVAMNSTQQFLSTIARVVERRTRPRRAVVAVEEPGYQTAMDTFERAGLQLVGMQADEFGVTPAGLTAVLADEVDLVVFTPRGLSPTGATWTAQRRMRLADLLAASPRAWIVEDDYFAELAGTSPGSMASDPRLANRTLHVRGFSKSIGPDLRVAVGLAGADILPALLEERSFADGWTSAFTQRALAAAIADPVLADRLEHARKRYERSRRAFLETWEEQVPGSEDWGPARTADGLHIWLRLPPGAHSTDVVQRCAADGYLVTSGEPFFLAPGRRDHLRVNVAAVDEARSSQVAKAVVRAVDQARANGSLLFAP